MFQWVRGRREAVEAADWIVSNLVTKRMVSFIPNEHLRGSEAGRGTTGEQLKRNSVVLMILKRFTVLNTKIIYLTFIQNIKPYNWLEFIINKNKRNEHITVLDRINSRFQSLWLLVNSLVSK